MSISTLWRDSFGNELSFGLDAFDVSIQFSLTFWAEFLPQSCKLGFDQGAALFDECTAFRLAICGYGVPKVANLVVHVPKLVMKTEQMLRK